MNIQLSVPHVLPEAEALLRITGLLREFRRQYVGYIDSVEERWSGNVGTFTLKVLNLPVAGTIEVHTDAVRITGELPKAALLLRSSIEDRLRNETQRCLTRAMAHALN